MVNLAQIVRHSGFVTSRTYIRIVSLTLDKNYQVHVTSSPPDGVTAEAVTASTRDKLGHGIKKSIKAF